MNPHEENNLERLIGQVVHDLPPRRAPSSLEQRVQAEIARRAALPWWRKSFAHWPMAARAVFLVLCAGFVKLAFSATMWVLAGVNGVKLKATFAPELQTLAVGGRLARTVTDLGSSMVASVPPLWLYGGIAVVAGLYIALFGLGAAAYRTLYASR